MMISVCNHLIIIIIPQGLSYNSTRAPSAGRPFLLSASPRS